MVLLGGRGLARLARKPRRLQCGSPARCVRTLRPVRQVYVPPAVRPGNKTALEFATVAALNVPWAIFGGSTQRWYRDDTRPVTLRVRLRDSIVGLDGLSGLWGKVIYLCELARTQGDMHSLYFLDAPDRMLATVYPDG